MYFDGLIATLLPLFGEGDVQLFIDIDKALLVESKQSCFID